MTIETKFNINDKVYFVLNQEIILDTIVGISINQGKRIIDYCTYPSGDEITYHTKSKSNILESNLFKNKSELINDLEKAIRIVG